MDNIEKLSQRARQFAWLATLCLATSSALAGANEEQPRSVAKPLIYDTGYEIVLPIASPTLHWVDNDRLLFAGMKAGRGPRPDLRKLYLWEASAKSITFYADAKAVCVVDGIVRYQVRVDEVSRKRVVREGLLGAEREIEETSRSKDEISREPSVPSNFTCRSHLRSELIPPAQRFRHVVVLRKGHGYLDLEPGGGANLLEQLRAPKKNLVLYQAEGKAIELPLAWDEQFSEWRVTFSAYRGAYVLPPRAAKGNPIGIVGPWPKEQPLIVYLLWPDGKTEAISIPYHPAEYIAHPQSVRPGWIFGGGNFYKAAGLYLFDGHAVSRLDAGVVRETAASADGCKAAVAIQNDHLNMGTPTNLRIFDFCAGRR